MEITTELIQSIYNRAKEHARATFDKEPDYIRVLHDGNLEVVYTYYGNNDENEYYEITAENLTEDLEEIAKKRLAEQAERRRLADIKRQEEKEKQLVRDKENRKAQYLQLKKEFE